MLKAFLHYPRLPCTTDPAYAEPQKDTRTTMTATRTTMLAALATLAALGMAALPQAVHAQTQTTTLTLNTGDVVTVDDNGTNGLMNGAPIINNTTKSYSGDPAVVTNGNSAFTLGSGGTLSGSNSGLSAYDSSIVTITGGTITAGSAAAGLGAYGGTVSISGGAINGGSQGYGIFAGSGSSVTITGGTVTGAIGLYAPAGTIDLYGSFAGVAPGTSTNLPYGSRSSFFGTLRKTTRWARHSPISPTTVSPSTPLSPPPGTVTVRRVQYRLARSWSPSIQSQTRIA